jgi:flap endonuclease-1
MGLISGLKYYIPANEILVYDLKGKRLAIDIFNSLYQFLSAIRDSKGELLKQDDIVVSHLYGIMWKYGYLLSKGVKLIFVYDGIPNEDKNETLLLRKIKRRKAEEEFEKALKENDYEKSRMLGKRTSYIDNEIIGTSKKLANMLGIDYIDAKEEGEAQAVELVKEGLADYVVTQDYDAIAFNCESIIRNLNTRSKGKYINPNIISSSKVFKSMGLSYEQFLYFVFMTGTDFNYGIKNIGIKRAIFLASKSDNDESLINNIIEEGYIFPYEKESKLNELKFVLNKFENPAVYKKDEIKIIKGKFNKQAIIDYLSKLNFNIERFMPLLDKIDQAVSSTN